MTRRDIAELIDAYRTAARRFLAAGFDGLEVLAHGYLSRKFLSRFSNTRSDEYGGSLANRLRLPLQVFEVVREAAPDGVPCRRRGRDRLVRGRRRRTGHLPIDAGPEVHVVGDALASRRTIDAIWDGFRIAI